jgi:hypothetical protein
VKRKLIVRGEPPNVVVIQDVGAIWVRTLDAGGVAANTHTDPLLDAGLTEGMSADILAEVLSARFSADGDIGFAALTNNAVWLHCGWHWSDVHHNACEGTH